MGLAAASLTGCSRNPSIGRDEVKSGIRSARSFAAESAMLVDFILQGHATRHYAQEHSTYLQDEVEQSAKELRQGVPAPEIQDSVRECLTQFAALAHELSGIRDAAGHDDRDALAAAKRKLTEIRESLEKANSHL
jgi:hypothetical protein